MLFLLIFLKFFFLLSNVAALGITIQSETIVGRPSLVFWTREPSDGDNALTFDLRFVRPGFEDVGLAIANIQASPSAQLGTVQVIFPSPGPYELVAVSGPDATNLGRSNQVNALKTPLHSTTSVYSTSTCHLMPSATTSAHPTSAASRAHHKKNIGAIIGGTLGGVAFLGLLAALVTVFLRRRNPTNRRWTFYRDMMVRPANFDMDSTPPTISQSSSPPDMEQGLPHDNLPSEVMIGSPNGPRRLIRPLPLPPGPLKTRQEDIVERMEQVKNQMMELEQNPGPTQHIILDDLQKQMSWLQDQVGSAWAMGLTDVTPLGFAHNLAR